jgi:signal transduction histidine kinase
MQQVAGFLAGIASYPDESSMTTAAAHRIAEAVDAEVCAVTAGERVVAALGFPVEAVPVEMLVGLAAAGHGQVDIPGLGPAPVEVTELHLDVPAYLLIARTGAGLSAEELHLVRTMAQVLELALRLRRAADRERGLRERSESQAQALRSANERLQEVARLKSDLISTTSHELRTPLTSILGFTMLLRDRKDAIGEAERGEYLGVIQKHGERLLRLVDDLLLVGRLEAGRIAVAPRPVPLFDVVRASLQEHGFEEVTLTGERDAIAVADIDHVDQVITNLITNARKYGAPPIEVEVRQERSRVCFAVTDHGSGVPEHFIERMFEPFSQASTGDGRNSVGTGLGLAIVHGLVRMSDGEIRYERSDGRTRFVVSFPTLEARFPEVSASNLS